MQFDNIIIGSGAGALSAAICLSREGQSVLVLEQHDVPGGWCHSFYLEGHQFSPGVHYIGMLNEGGSTRELYEGLGVANDLTFFRMRKEAYEHCHIGDEKIDLPSNFHDLYQVLSERFPHEKKGLKKYLELIENVGKQLALIPEMSGFWDHITIPYRTRHLGKYGLFSLKRVINWFIKDPLLQTILNVQSGNHGLPPARASFPVHCAVMDHYAKGGFYPKGGGAAIVKSMTKLIKKNGGEIRTSSSVKQILIEDTGKKNNKRAIGVELESGEQIFAKRIISNADPEVTYRKLVGENHLSKGLIKKLNGTKYSSACLMLFLVVDMDLRKAGIDSGNIWKAAKTNLDEAYDDLLDIDVAKGEKMPSLFISCPTIKDPTSFNGRYHTIEAVTFTNHNAFDAFRTPEKRKSQAYQDLKEAIANKMINAIEEVVPGIREKIVIQELGTPLTNEHYINTTNGCAYGTEKTFKQVGPLSYKPKSEIENLYLCGASILSHGVAGATFSGVQTAAEILGCKQKDLIQPIEGQRLKVYDAEDDNDYPEEILAKMKVRKSRAKVESAS